MYLLLLQIHDLYFLLIVIGCVCIYTNIFLTITCSVCTMLLVCMFPELTIWQWTINWCVLPWGRPPLPSPALPVINHNSLCRLESSWAFPQPVWYVVLVQIAFAQSGQWGCMGGASGITRRHNLTTPSSPCLYYLSALFSRMFPEP